MSKRLAGVALAVPLTLSACLVATTAWGADERPGIGGVDRVQPDATATHGADTRTLAIGDTVFFQDLLETTAEARLAVTLEDGTKLTLGEGASLRIDEFVYLPDGETGKLSLSVLQGAFLFVGGETENMEHTQVDIQTPVGTLGVRGTTVWGGHIDGSFGVLVTQGRVTVKNAAGEVGLDAGEGTQIAAMDAVPTPPKQWPEAKVRRALETVSFKGD